MKSIAEYISFNKLLILVPIIGLSLLTNCGGGSTSSGGDIFSDDDIFADGCGISDPGFPFCGGNWVRCRDQDQILYQVFDKVCPTGWTIVPEDVPFPDLACTHPEGRTFNVDADQCPPGWTEFTIDLTF